MWKLGPRISKNRILARLPENDSNLLFPHLDPIDLPLRMSIELGDRPIDHVYFVEQGFASVVTNGSKKRSMEVGLIGREGVTGLAVIMGSDQTPNETYMQHAGAGQRITSAKLREAMEQSRSLLLAYGHVFMVQTAYTALSNGRRKLEERLARWLLMAHDRIDSNEIILTHEFSRLDARSAPVWRHTHAQPFGEAGSYLNNGIISIIDRGGLEECSKGAYGAPEAEFRICSPKRFGGSWRVTEV